VNGMIVVNCLDELSYSHTFIQVQSDLLSRWLRVFLISRLEPCAKVHAEEAGRYAHVMTPPICVHNLTSRPTSSNCCTATLILVRDWQKNAHLRDRRTCNVKEKRSMRNMEHETLQVPTSANTNDPATTIFCDKHS